VTVMEIVGGAAGLTLSTWGDVTAFVAVVGGLFTGLGVAANATYTRRKNAREDSSADAAARDRLIDLIKEEAEKRVAIVRLEFEKKIAELQLAHAQELASVRVDFQRQIALLAVGQRQLTDLAGLSPEGIQPVPS